MIALETVYNCNAVLFPFFLELDANRKVIHKMEE
jgi:hypothetical protein